MPSSPTKPTERTVQDSLPKAAWCIEELRQTVGPKKLRSLQLEQVLSAGYMRSRQEVNCWICFQHPVQLRQNRRSSMLLFYFATGTLSILLPVRLYTLCANSSVILLCCIRFRLMPKLLVCRLACVTAFLIWGRNSLVPEQGDFFQATRLTSWLQKGPWMPMLVPHAP